MGKTYVLWCYVLLVLWGVSAGGAEKEEVGIYELKRGDFTVQLTNFGAIVLSVILPDKNGFPLFLISCLIYFLPIFFLILL